ncbi:MAG TPA: glycosyltransferase family 4 protein [Candidatus Didemnitutus sp.]|jgi:glycosyltransferase involved in cell wall biosynthesis
MTRPRPRVILINRVYWPSEAATAQLLTDLAEGLAGRDWDVHVIAAGREDVARHGVTIHRSGGETAHGGMVSRAANYARFLRAAARVLRVLARAGDVIVAMTDPPQLACRVAAAATASGATTVHWIQDIYPEILTAHVGRWARLALTPLTRVRNRAWMVAGRCVTVGEDMGETLAAAGVLPSRRCVIPNWAPRVLEIQPAPAEVAAARRDWGADGRFVVAYSGNLGRVHEFGAVVRAATSLRDCELVQFVFVGGGPRLRQVKAAVSDIGLSNVRFLPAQPRDRLAAVMAVADAHLVTLRPGFEHLVYPSKLAGILAAGRPALFVGPAGSQIARFVVRERCGLAFGPESGEDLAAAIRSLAKDPERTDGLGRAARGAYERHFTFASALDAWDSVLRSASR